MPSIFEKFSKHKKFKDEIIPPTREFEFISTGILNLNLLFSGKVFGGVMKGSMTMMSAPSQLGKSFVGMNVLKNAQKAGMECMILHTEKNFDFKWAEKIGIDTAPDKLLVFEISNLTSLKQIVQEAVEGKSRKERENLFILIDSWGSIVTTVQQKKAGEGSETKDMSEAYWKNGFANIIKDTDVTAFILNHVYDNVGGFGDPLEIPGGKRLYFNSQSVVLGSSVAKDRETDNSISGDIITARTHKGRGVYRYTTLKYRIKQSGGLDLFYGLLPDALEAGVVEKPKNGKYSRPCIEDDKEWKEKQIYCKDFWLPVFKETDFAEWLEDKYTPKNQDLDISGDDITIMIQKDGVNVTQVVSKEEAGIVDEDED